MDKLLFSTVETAAAVTTANLSLARTLIAACASISAGYFAGGSTDISDGYANRATADKLAFSTDTTAAVTTANLIQARYAIGASASAAAGYFAGGYAGANLATADKLSFSTDATAAQTSADLPVALRGIAGL